MDTARTHFPTLHVRDVYAALKRNDLAPTANNFGTLHRLLLQYGAYPDEPVQVVTPAPVEEVETRTPSEIAEAKYKARMTEIVVYDPIDNKGYTEFDLENKVDAKTERRLRRLMEGKIGNNNYDTYRNQGCAVPARSGHSGQSRSRRKRRKLTCLKHFQTAIECYDQR